MLFLKIYLTICFVVLPCYSDNLKNSLLSKIVKRSPINRLKSSTTNDFYSNHPPLEENYAPIPVAIVYDEKLNDQNASSTEKTITAFHPRFFKTAEQVTTVLTTEASIEESSTPSTIKKITIKNRVSTEDKIIKPIKSRVKEVKESQIPVVIVYDPVIDGNLKRNIEIEKSETVRNVRRNNRQRGRTIKPDESIEILTTPTSTIINLKEVLPTSEVARETSITERKYIPSRTRSSPNKQTNEYTTQATKTSKAPTTTSSTFPNIVTVKEQNNTILGVVHNDATRETNPSPITRKQGIRSRSNATKLKEQNIISSEIAATTTTTAVKTTTEEMTTARSITETEKAKPSDEAVKTVTKNVKPGRMRDPVVPIVESQNILYAQTGVFHYSYEGGDGTKNFEDGKLKSFDDEATGESVSGGFSYKDKDGKNISLTYTADENGYRPIGDHLPTPPPIPPAIARALRYLATKTAEPEDVTESLSKSKNE